MLQVDQLVDPVGVLIHLNHWVQVGLDAGLVHLWVDCWAWFPCCSSAGAHLADHIVIAPLLVLSFPHSHFAISSSGENLSTLCCCWSFACAAFYRIRNKRGWKPLSLSDFTYQLLTLLLSGIVPKHDWINSFRMVKFILVPKYQGQPWFRLLLLVIHLYKDIILEFNLTKVIQLSN